MSFGSETTTRLVEGERGAVTLWMVAWTAGFIALAGAAVDVGNAYRNRAMLQAVADAASHAGAAELARTGSAEKAKAAAVAIAEANFRDLDLDNVVAEEDVVVGAWDGTRVLEGFFADTVRVDAARAAADGNAVSTALLRIIDFDSFDVAAASASQVVRLGLPPGLETDDLVYLDDPGDPLVPGWYAGTGETPDAPGGPDAPGDTGSGDVEPPSAFRFLCPNGGAFARESIKIASQSWFGDGLCVHGYEVLNISGRIEHVGMGSYFTTGPEGKFRLNSTYDSIVEKGGTVERWNIEPIAAKPENVLARMQNLLDEVETYGAPLVIDAVVPTKDNGKTTGRDKPKHQDKKNGRDESDGTDTGTSATEEGTDGGASEGDDAPGSGNIVLSYGFKHVTDPGKGYPLAEDIDAGYRYFYIECTDGGDFTMHGKIDLTNVTILSSCSIDAHRKAEIILRDTVIGVDKPGDNKSIKLHGKSIDAGSDGCAGFGKVTLLSTGGIHFGPETAFTQVEMVASGKIKFTSSTYIYGTSLQSWGEIDWSAKKTLDNCSGVPDDNAEFWPVVRIAG